MEAFTQDDIDWLRGAEYRSVLGLEWIAAALASALAPPDACLAVFDLPAEGGGSNFAAPEFAPRVVRPDSPADLDRLARNMRLGFAGILDAAGVATAAAAIARHRPVVLARPDALPALAAMGYAVCDLAGQAWPATATRGAQPPGDLAVAIHGASERDFAKVADATLARVRLGRLWHRILS